ncbi:ATP-grasp domain-containing protein [Streptacidiphilus jiangxiensis]|uniref:ATP-grasp domain-containing protein n=1 Tax=Streptacidiphilus jiangxiensis TaxID=235985 RepID=A0A1H7VKP1_STRJI|nr:ATP-grasp domain-containing protein [Streptacidiphilus jiangxiensis]SEM09793.1 ATP-grasp domain-containing protein [Streptacidiphilus jiangxiensis]
MHIVIVNRWPRFDDGVRWDNELTRYEEFIDHDAHRVSYVVDGPGARGVLVDPSRIAHLVQVEDVNNVESLRTAVLEVTAKVGPVDQLIALSEFTLEIAARVREELGLPGPDTAEVAVYRDKVRMKELLAEAGMRVPRFAACVSTEQALAFAESCGFPVILKPVDGAASIGVHRVEDASALAELLPTLDLARYEIEEFVTGEIFHVDGYADEGSGVVFQVASRYVNDCLAFGAGAPLGSVVVQRSDLRDRIEAFTQQCVSSLGMRITPFHLELFVTPDGDLVFLEIGGRVGGSEVPHLLNRVFGVNLYEVWLRNLSGESMSVPAKQGDPSGGWLVLPKPSTGAVRVVTARSMRDRVPSVWRELLPGVGEVLEPGGAYDALHSGRFILLGDDEKTVESDIHHIIENYEFEVAAV